jgi:uncharacterized short protein YbdD (DUF466 family)
MRKILGQLKTALRAVWTGLRQWSGDAAYERYLDRALRHGTGQPLSEAEFYVEQLNQRYSRPNRCC